MLEKDYLEQLKQLYTILPRYVNAQNIILAENSTQLLLNCAGTLPQYQYEILIHYSRNYQQPVLCFNKFDVTVNSEGFEVLQPAKPDLPQFETSVTQIGAKTYWFIHPCDTKELLSASPGADYLLNWCSVYLGQLVDMRLPAGPGP